MRFRNLYTTTIYGHKREVGKYDPSQNIAYFPVYWEKHFFRKANAWGIDLDVLEKLRDLKCEKIVLVTDRGEKYISSLENFDMHSWTHQYSNFSPRKMMALDKWDYIPQKSAEEKFKEIFIENEVWS